MILETERLYLREMTEEDFNALYQVLADSDIMQHYPYVFDEGRVRNWITRNRERYQIFGFGLWAVVLKQTGEMIGDCGLTMQKIGETIKPEIGYHIRKDQQRKGYAKEAAAAVRDWTFMNTPFGIIYSYMKGTNIPSMQTAASWGCHKVEEFKDEENEITNVFAITRNEWQKAYADVSTEKEKEAFLADVDRIHTTELGGGRIQKNLRLLDDIDPVAFCKSVIMDPVCHVLRRGKNWYCTKENIQITVNAYSYTIITAKLLKLGI